MKTGINGVSSASAEPSIQTEKDVERCRNTDPDPHPQQPLRKLARIAQGASPSPAAKKEAHQVRTLLVKAQNQEQPKRTLTLEDRLGPRHQPGLLARLLEAKATQPDASEVFRQNKTKLLK
ncbi:hypothetical protein PTTG_29555 [Puccinia triticina 1-1 BBBD Race 1]|uniref:Uncharacterized protein n=1 Tax=Puccinia triticina (isolate 1-1 / race 1 (BBBD)) TaxID=630390 RepID=A0A180G5J8_PUCT1|nr:hypothetical protein PTTG_29555 [Puccinia triticina 1-1 BBBD Race 1]